MSPSHDGRCGMLLPNAPETQTEAHGGCARGMPCPRRHWVPASSGHTSHPALPTGLHKARPSKVAPQPPCPGMVPRPPLAPWPRPRQPPGPVRGSASGCSTKLLCSAQVVPVTLCPSPRPAVSRDSAFQVSQEQTPGSPSAGGRMGLCWAGARLPRWLCLHGAAGGGGSVGSSAADTGVQGERETAVPSPGEQSPAPRSGDDRS